MLTIRTYRREKNIQSKTIGSVIDCAETGGVESVSYDERYELTGGTGYPLKFVVGYVYGKFGLPFEPTQAQWILFQNSCMRWLRNRTDPWFAQLKLIRREGGRIAFRLNEVQGEKTQSTMVYLALDQIKAASSEVYKMIKALFIAGKDRRYFGVSFENDHGWPLAQCKVLAKGLQDKAREMSEPRLALCPATDWALKCIGNATILWPLFWGTNAEKGDILLYQYLVNRATFQTRVYDRIKKQFRFLYDMFHEYGHRLLDRNDPDPPLLQFWSNKCPSHLAFTIVDDWSEQSQREGQIQLDKRETWIQANDPDCPSSFVGQLATKSEEMRNKRMANKRSGNDLVEMEDVLPGYETDGSEAEYLALDNDDARH